jgi:hypothetical protein
MQTMDGLFRFSLLLLFVPVLLGAVLGALVTWLGIRRRTAIRSWPSVEANILSGEVEENEHRGWYFVKTRTWDFVIEYEYAHAGRTYRSKVRLLADVPGGSHPEPQALEDALARARQRLLDRLVTVRLNPDDPSETAWPEENPGRAWLRLTLFALAALVSLAVLAAIFSS